MGRPERREDDRVQRRALPRGLPARRGGPSARSTRSAPLRCRRSSCSPARRSPMSRSDRRRLGLRRHDPDDGLGTAGAGARRRRPEARPRRAPEAVRALVAEAFLYSATTRGSRFPTPRFEPTARRCGASSRTRRSSAAWRLPAPTRRPGGGRSRRRLGCKGEATGAASSAACSLRRRSRGRGSRSPGVRPRVHARRRASDSTRSSAGRCGRGRAGCSGGRSSARGQSSPSRRLPAMWAESRADSSEYRGPPLISCEDLVTIRAAGTHRHRVAKPSGRLARPGFDARRGFGSTRTGRRRFSAGCRARDGGPSTSGVLIVPPIGYAYWSATGRSDLAERLAANGHLALRIDYNSDRRLRRRSGPGRGAPRRLARSVAVRGASCPRRGCREITLVGVQLGATFALIEGAAVEATRSSPGRRSFRSPLRPRTPRPLAQGPRRCPPSRSRGSDGARGNGLHEPDPRRARDPGRTELAATPGRAGASSSTAPRTMPWPSGSRRSGSRSTTVRSPAGRPPSPGRGGRDRPRGDRRDDLLADRAGRARGPRAATPGRDGPDQLGQRGGERDGRRPSGRPRSSGS